LWHVACHPVEHSEFGGVSVNQSPEGFIRFILTSRFSLR
jgi:hypothetical protein